MPDGRALRSATFQQSRRCRRAQSWKGFCPEILTATIPRTIPVLGYRSFLIHKQPSETMNDFLCLRAIVLAVRDSIVSLRSSSTNGIGPVRSSAISPTNTDSISGRQRETPFAMSSKMRQKSNLHALPCTHRDCLHLDLLLLDCRGILMITTLKDTRAYQNRSTQTSLVTLRSTASSNVWLNPRTCQLRFPGCFRCNADLHRVPMPGNHAVPSMPRDAFTGIQP